MFGRDKLQRHAPHSIISTNVFTCKWKINCTCMDIVCARLLYKVRACCTVNIIIQEHQLQGEQCLYCHDFVTVQS